MDTQIATQTRTSESRMGTVDTLLGLIAAVAVDPRGRLIPVGDFYNILHKLKADRRFADDLRYIDFEAVGDNFYSEALDKFLFQAGTWGLHQVPNPAVSSICLDPARAQSRLEEFETEFGHEPVRRLRDELAAAFIEELENAAGHAG